LKYLYICKLVNDTINVKINNNETLY